jgi:hypothetical protein
MSGNFRFACHMEAIATVLRIATRLAVGVADAQSGQNSVPQSSAVPSITIVSGEATFVDPGLFRYSKW